ncbi:MAG: aminoacetone oxidase family FAD-binding enzyme [Bacillota bacterium]|nr:aminoacetone oxidase family FAD-binding enzyme [Bacillota bacterium]
MYDVIVVGLGAAGLFATANLDSRHKVLGIEASKRPGLKLGITGGGRCNLTNTDEIKKLVDSYTNPSFVRPILHAFNNLKTKEYFESRGLPLIEENSKLFPKSQDAKDVIAFFLSQIEKRGHRLHVEEEVLELVSEEGFVTVKSAASAYTCKKVIIACGGATFPQTGSTGRLLKKCFAISPFEPALSSLFIKEASFVGLQGVSIKAELKYGKKRFAGDLLFAGGMLSGPVAMDLSNYIQEGEAFTADFLPGRGKEELKEALQTYGASYPKRKLQSALLDCTELPQSLVKLVLSQLALAETGMAELKSEDLNALLERLKAGVLHVEAKLPLEKAIVSKGGIKCADIDNRTMCLKSDPNIIVVGEAIELVGACGGYNLQFAFSSAHRAVSNL